MFRTIACFAALSALAACSGGDETGERRAGSASSDAVSEAGPGASAEADTGAAKMEQAVRGAQVASGQWFAKTMMNQPAALFGPPQSEARFSVRCDRGTLVLVRSVLLEGASATMHLMAGGRERTMAASARHDPMPQVVARLAADDPTARALARTSENFAIAIDDAEPFVLPPSTILREVVADCDGAPG